MSRVDGIDSISIKDERRTRLGRQKKDHFFWGGRGFDQGMEALFLGYSPYSGSTPGSDPFYSSHSPIFNRGVGGVKNAEREE